MSLITNFKDLYAWKEAHNLVLMIYKVTNNFPSKEKFSLIDQMRRACVSISSNIAEGFTRLGRKEKIQFYYMAKSSLTELQNQNQIAHDVGYVKIDEYMELETQVVKVGKLITGLIKSIRR